MDDRYWINTLANRCQGVVGSVLRSHGASWPATLAHLLDDAPTHASTPTQVMTEGLVIDLLCGVARAVAMRDDDVRRALSDFLLARCGTDDALHALTQCINVLEPIQWVNPEAARPSAARVRSALRFVHDHASEGLTLAKVARQVGVSPWHLSRLLRRHTGHTFMTHLHTHRVLHAQRLLLESELSIKEVANAVGYSNTTQLDRNFLKQCGMTPKVFRRSGELPGTRLP